MAFFVAFDFGFMGYDIGKAVDGAVWWNLVLSGFMLFYGLNVLGSYKRHYERKAEKAGRAEVHKQWQESIDRKYEALVVRSVGRN